MATPSKEPATVSVIFVPREDAAERMARVLAILLGEEEPSVMTEAA